MNLRLVARMLGILSMLIGGAMIFSLPWAYTPWGHRTYEMETPLPIQFETAGFLALVASIVICLVVGLTLWGYLGREAGGSLFRKEAMAVVGLSWVLATILGALPFWFSGTSRRLSVRLFHDAAGPQLYGRSYGLFEVRHDKPPLSKERFQIITTLLNAGAVGLTGAELESETGLEDPEAQLRDLAGEDPDWRYVLLFPGMPGPADRENHFRIRPVKMTFVDSLFESQSGFSTTGATVIADLEDPVLVPHCILFWRSSTHFLGGLGIIVLFVAILGQGSAGKALMRAEMPGPSADSSQSRMQHTAWVFAAIYCALNLVQTIILWCFGLTWFDALCHAFGTMATGGFSTYNKSLGNFQSIGELNGAAIDYTVLIFMVIAGMNFSLIYFVVIGRAGRMLADVEWRAYMAVLAVMTLLVVTFGLAYGDFPHLSDAIRYGSFQVVSIMTTTGFGTHDFNRWNSFGRGALFLLMFVGGCAGSTGGGLKVIRHVLFLKILGLEIERSFHPTVVRPLRLGKNALDDPDLRKNILVYFSLILVIFVFSWMAVVTLEPDSTWGISLEHKLIDSATAIAATLNNIGPGLGIIGATENYSNFSSFSKLLFTWLMMLGRLEIFVILVLFMPSFWRNR